MEGSEQTHTFFFFFGFMHPLTVPVTAHPSSNDSSPQPGPSKSHDVSLSPSILTDSNLCNIVVTTTILASYGCVSTTASVTSPIISSKQSIHDNLQL